MEEDTKGATILEPMIGLHNGFILDIDASNAYKRIWEDKQKGKYQDFDLIKFMEEIVLSVEKEHKPLILCGDTDFLHIMIQAENRREAYDIGNIIAADIEYKYRELMKTLDSDYVHVFGFPDIKLRGIADSSYYHAKKRYIMRYIWLYGHRCNFYKIAGIKNVALNLDLKQLYYVLSDNNVWE